MKMHIANARVLRAADLRAADVRVDLRVAALRAVALYLVMSRLLSPSPSSAAEGAGGDDPSAIMAKSLQASFYPGKDMKARITMKLIPKSGGERLRELTFLRRNETAAGEQKYYIYFHQPADVKGTSFLVAKFPGRDDDRWLFVPALNLVKRLAARDASQSFVGSDFTYEDVSGRDLDADSHRLLREEKAGERDCWVIESTPVAPAEYKRKVTWIDKATWLPVKEEDFDARGELFKSYSAEEIQDIGGHPTVVRRLKTSVKTGHHTEVVYADVSYDNELDAAVFTERSLREPPRKWIQ